MVNGVPHNIYEGFWNRYDAEVAYVLAYALGTVRVLPNRAGQALQTHVAQPTPEAFMTALERVDDEFLGMRWHVVFKGKRPGVYPSWYVQPEHFGMETQNSLFCCRLFSANQTLNVPNAVQQSYDTRAQARAAYALADELHEVQTL